MTAFLDIAKRLYEYGLFYMFEYKSLVQISTCPLLSFVQDAFRRVKTLPATRSSQFLLII